MFFVQFWANLSKYLGWLYAIKDTLTVPKNRSLQKPICFFHLLAKYTGVEKKFFKTAEVVISNLKNGSKENKVPTICSMCDLLESLSLCTYDNRLKMDT